MLTGLSGLLSESLRKKLRFLAAGIVNTLFGYGVYFVLLFLKFPYQIALLVATILGIVFNYFSFGFAVFDGKNSKLIFFKFAVSYVAIYFSNAFLLGYLTESLSMDPYFSQIICLPISVIMSWLLMNFWVYKNG